MGTRRTLDFKLKKVVIVGASGFVGGRLAAELILRGFDVCALNRNLNSDIPNGIQTVAKFNSENSDEMSRLLLDCEVVIYCAGSNAGECARDPRSAILDNSIKAYDFSELCAQCGVQKFFYISTAHVYSSSPRGVINEDSPTSNLHPYAISRVTAERLIENLYKNKQMNFTSIRLSNSFGVPHSKNVNCWSLFVNQLCLNVIQNKVLQIKSNPKTQRDFIPLNTACSQIIDLIKGNVTANIINLGAFQSRNLLEMSHIITENYEKTWKKSIQIEYDESLAIDSCQFTYQSKQLTKIDENKIIEDMNCEITDLLSFCQEEFSQK